MDNNIARRNASPRDWNMKDYSQSYYKRPEQKPAFKIDSFDLFDTISANLKAGYDNIGLALSGHPIDALTNSAVEARLQKDPTYVAATPAQQKIMVANASSATQDKIVSDAKDAVNSITDIFGNLKWYLIAIVVIILLMKFSK